jgi:hypothetical protein
MVVIVAQDYLIEHYVRDIWSKLRFGNKRRSEKHNAQGPASYADRRIMSDETTKMISV